MSKFYFPRSEQKKKNTITLGTGTSIFLPKTISQTKCLVAEAYLEMEEPRGALYSRPTYIYIYNSNPLLSKDNGQCHLSDIISIALCNTIMILIH